MLGPCFIPCILRIRALPYFILGSFGTGGAVEPQKRIQQVCSGQNGERPAQMVAPQPETCICQCVPGLVAEAQTLEIRSRGWLHGYSLRGWSMA